MRKLIALVAVFAVGVLAASSAYAETVTIKGSTTVLPIAQACAEEFMNKNASINISVQGGGSGVGIASILDGTADIGDASRPIKDKELDKAVSRGIDPKAHVVAMDGIAVVVNPSNSLEAITKQQVKDIYTGKISNWSELGAGSGQIVIISRDTASGTYEAFNNLALNKARVRPDALLEASNQAVASVVAKTPGAIGYIGLGYLTDKLKAVTVDGDNAIIENNLLTDGDSKAAQILTLFSCDNCLVRRNEFRRTNPQTEIGCFVHGASTGSHRISGNIFHSLAADLTVKKTAAILIYDDYVASRAIEIDGNWIEGRWDRTLLLQNDAVCWYNYLDGLQAISNAYTVEVAGGVCTLMGNYLVANGNTLYLIAVGEDGVASTTGSILLFASGSRWYLGGPGVIASDYNHFAGSLNPKAWSGLSLVDWIATTGNDLHSYAGGCLRCD